MAEKRLSACSHHRLRLEIAHAMVTKRKDEESQVKRVCKSQAGLSNPLGSPSPCSFPTPNTLPMTTGDECESSIADEELLFTGTGDISGIDEASSGPDISGLDADVGQSDEELTSRDSLSLSDSSLTFSSSVSDSDKQACITSDTSPLFPGSDLESKDFITSFMCLAQRHNLTYTCQADMLKLLKMVLPPPNEVPSSAHTLITQLLERG